MKLKQLYSRALGGVVGLRKSLGVIGLEFGEAAVLCLTHTGARSEGLSTLNSAEFNLSGGYYGE